ncbi:hypothetical protein [Anaerostipes faecalis]|uniref:hypothetical protein n=1 Tax=Anaerostipes faecalis TaxID=2738446 RepID=UPI001C1E23C5|nr:hypothetical protein [Anaerostipes faecalis]
MLSILFGILMIMVFGKLLIFAVKASWGIVKILFTVAVLPLVLIGLVMGGLIYIAFPVLIIIGIISLIDS